jgi:protein MpaA
MAEDRITETVRRSCESFLEPLWTLPGIQFSRLGCFSDSRGTYSLPRFTAGDLNSSDVFRIGIFAAIHGDEPAGALAAAAFVKAAAESPGLVENFLLTIYPVCNPTGFEDNTRHSRTGRDLNREFWRQSPEVEVKLLEQELRTQHFHGIIQLHADDTSDGVYGFVRGHTLTENLLRPALLEAAKILPRNVNALIDGFAARDGIIHDIYEGVLAAPEKMDPVPFEIILETPHKAAVELQVQCFVTAIKTILREYRGMMAFANDI